MDELDLKLYAEKIKKVFKTITVNFQDTNRHQENLHQLYIHFSMDEIDLKLTP